MLIYLLLIWQSSSAVTQLSCNLTGAFKKTRICMGEEGGNLGPRTVHTSSVLQNMEFVVVSFVCGLFCCIFCLLPYSALFLIDSEITQ